MEFMECIQFLHVVDKKLEEQHNVRLPVGWRLFVKDPENLWREIFGMERIKVYQGS
jgi:hypothetical protein